MQNQPTPSSFSAAPLENLRRRADLARRLRAFFDSRGFTEVHTPILSTRSIIDRHLDPIRVPGSHVGLPGVDGDWYLQTSPEQSMKRLLASGIGSIYQLGPVFRAGESGQYHNPEFTMAEWYDLDAGFEQGLSLLDQLCGCLLDTPPATRQRFSDAFQQSTGLELFETDASQLGRWCVENAMIDSADWTSDWDDWVNLIFSMRVQPSLGMDRPVLITHFPASQAALAKLDRDDPRTAERYELFYRGVELANGYHELLDGDVLRQRAELAAQQRLHDGKFAIPVDNPLLDAMAVGIPASCGCALGFDRVVMLACGAERLDQVVAFMADRA